MLSYEEFCKKIRRENVIIYEQKKIFKPHKLICILEDINGCIKVFEEINTGKKLSYDINYLYKYQYLKGTLRFESEQKLNYGDKFFVVDYEYERIYCEAVTLIGRDVDGNIYYNSLRPEHCYTTYEEALQALKRGE